MARRLRIARGEIVYHVLNRAVGRREIFTKVGDYEAFEKALAEAHKRFGMRVLAYCIMPNHWHLVLWPRRDGDLSRYMQWLTTTHMRRWHANRRSAGTGPVYQGRFKSFPSQSDAHLLTVCRYVERNPVRANMVKSARKWRWSSAWRRNDPAGRVDWLVAMKDWPVRPNEGWDDWVDRAETAKELEALRRSVWRGSPFGDEAWQKRTAARLRLESSLRPPWRPKKPGKAERKDGKEGGMTHKSA